MTNGRVVRSRSKESALARKGMLSSKAASNVRRTTPVTDRCQPPSCLTRAARPRSEKRRGGEEGRSRGAQYYLKKKIAPSVCRMTFPILGSLLVRLVALLTFQLLLV